MNANEKLTMAQASKMMGQASIATTEAYYQRGAHVKDGSGHRAVITIAGYSHPEPNHHQSTETGEIHHE